MSCACEIFEEYLNLYYFVDMMSPIRAAPVLRNIRRCPNSFKAPKKKSKDNKEDILQCIDWSKNLFGMYSS